MPLAEKLFFTEIKATGVPISNFGLMIINFKWTSAHGEGRAGNEPWYSLVLIVEDNTRGISILNRPIKCKL